MFTHDEKDPHSIGENHITALALSEDGKIWIGTQKSGVSVYNPRLETFERIEFHQEDHQNLSSHSISSIHVSGHLILIGTTSSGLNVIDSSGEIVRLKNAPDDLNTISNNRIKQVIDAKEGGVDVHEFR